MGHPMYGRSAVYFLTRPQKTRTVGHLSIRGQERIDGWPPATGNEILSSFNEAKATSVLVVKMKAGRYLLARPELSLHRNAYEVL